MMQHVRTWPTVLALALCVCSGVAGAGDPTDSQGDNHRETSVAPDSLSGTLKRLSSAVLDRDYSRLADCFHQSVRFGAWLPPGQTVRTANDLVVHSRRLGSSVRSLRHPRAEMLDDWKTFLGRFQRIDDAGFLAEDVTAGDAPAWIEDARIEFGMTGRDHNGSQLWMAGEGRFDADFVPGQGWRFSRLEIDRVDEYRFAPDLLRASGRSAQ